MRVTLREYQATAVEQLLYSVDEAIRAVVRRPNPRAIAFAAPTGAGKTVMMAGLIEALLVGGEISAQAGVDPDPEISFLWLSDRPDLNEQSRRRILNDANGLAPAHFITIENDFDREMLAPRTVYFLNFQKLRAGSLLTQIGDNRSSTIWEIIAATQMARPGKLIVVIDEAHRGLSNREETEAQTIASNFVRGGQGQLTIRGRLGEPDVPFPPVQIVVGVSATPDRFNTYLTSDGGRTRADVTVQPLDVRESGLIKDRIVLVGPEDIDQQQREIQWTLLRHACQKTQEVELAWNEYVTSNPPIAPVVPALVVQVADGTAGVVTSTPLDLLINELRDEWLGLTPESIVHCFNNIDDIEPIPGWRIQYRAPNEIAEDRTIRVILFKTALNTGWDCPRAEVMMSFRSLADRTAIAQLVGRMVRTPLGQRVPGDAIRNSTYLYLPLFHQANLEAVKDFLTSDAYEISSEVVRASETQTLELRPGGDRLYEHLKLLPTETVAGSRPIPDVKRLTKLCRLLEHDELNATATRDAVASLLAIVRDRFNSLADTKEFDDQVTGRGLVSIASLSIQSGAITANEVQRAEISDEDIERAFRAASSILADELGLGWVRERYDDNDPQRAKLEFLELIRSPGVIPRVELEARRLFEEFERRYLPSIQRLADGRRDQYVSLQRSGRSTQRSLMAPEKRVIFPRSNRSTLQRGHLYVVPGTQDECALELNTWEQAVLAEERQRTDFLAFFRNLDRKRWSLSYAYEFGGTRPAFPDFLVFREGASGVLVDILEPHQGEDSLAKAKGMARFSEDYGAAFGRIQMVRLVGTNLVRLRLEQRTVRQAVLDRTPDLQSLIALFE